MIVKLFYCYAAMHAFLRGWLMARIMICDDAVFMLKSLSLTVTKMGHKVVAETIDGQDAVKSYMEEKPDLVLMDISMPVKDGIEALKEIMKIDPDAKVIIISGLGYQATVVDAVKAGAKEFLVKPVSYADLSRCIHKYVPVPVKKE